MDPREIVPAKFTRTKIWDITEKFREDYIHNEDIPVNIENVMQSAMGIQIIPVENLQLACSIEGFISLDFKYIYVDKYHYSTDIYYKRIRFTIAHEIGHKVLHRNIIDKIKFQTLNEWIAFRMNLAEDSLGWFEWQAYEFAGRLLVPINKLVDNFRTARNEILKRNTSWKTPAIDDAEIFTLVSPIIANKFDVSMDVIERRLNKEEIMNYFR
jgi:Zn-dependent peptidase ImmA (M78 family)